MDHVKIKLGTHFSHIPCQVKIDCCNKVVFDSVMDKDMELDFSVNVTDNFSIVINKKGKTKQITDAKASQELSILGITLNGIELDIAAFGMFHAYDNDYLDDHVLQTTHCTLNGTWTFTLPRYTIAGGITPGALGRTRDIMSDCDIACFGCSQTYGFSLQQEHSWPSQLALLTNNDVKNFGNPGSNIMEIVAFVEHYLERYKCATILMLLPYSMRRQIKTNEGVIENIATADSRQKEYIYHGERHIISSIAGRFHGWLRSIEDKGFKVFFGTYDGTSEHELWNLTPCKDYLLPLLKEDGYDKAPDGRHSGAEYWKDYAKLVKQRLDK